MVKRGSKFVTGEESLLYRTINLTPAVVTACPPHKQMNRENVNHPKCKLAPGVNLCAGPVQATTMNKLCTGE